jgi:nucleotide-binding universal stress UspA family protein
MSPQPLKHILVGHDFQECSEVATDYAVSLAQRFGARVTVLYAYEVVSLGAPESLVLAHDWARQMAVMAKEQLDKIVERIRRAGVKDAQPVLRQGTPWREIAAFAEGNQVDLVVVGSHGRHGVPHALLGSVAEKVVRTAPCPVLVVRGATAPS